MHPIRPFPRRSAEIFARWLSRWREGSRRSAIAGWPARIRSTPRSRRGCRTASATEGLFGGLDRMARSYLRLADGTTRVIHAGDVFLI
jgi:BirA family biotin operon repressor/biotin-[acetyl-CoA-carboxylase] ligase